MKITRYKTSVELTDPYYRIAVYYKGLDIIFFDSKDYFNMHGTPCFSLCQAEEIFQKYIEKYKMYEVFS